MFKPIRLHALTYGPEDNSAMLAWQKKFGRQIQIVSWSEPLTVPIQMAVAANLHNQDEVEGFLIHDHLTYQEPVIAKLLEKMAGCSLRLYATSNGSRALGEMAISQARVPQEGLESSVHQLPLAESSRYSA